MNSVRNAVKNAIVDGLIRQQGLSATALDSSAGESAISELATNVTDKVLEALGFSKEIQDMPVDKFLGSSFAIDL